MNNTIEITGRRFCMVAMAFACCALAAVETPKPIVFDTPAENDRGAMILGNGELGALAWVSADGTLHTVLQRSDTWNEAARHVKAGAIDYVTGMKIDEGTFHQELSLANGEFNASWRSGGNAVSVHYRVQHGDEPFAVCDVTGAPAAEAKVVNWRLYPGGSKTMGCEWIELGNQFSRINGADGKPLKFTVAADVLVPGGWCHVNRNETVAEMMRLYEKWQATEGLGKPDVLSNVAFGGLTRRVCEGARTLFISAVTRFQPCSTAAEWRRRTEALIEAKGWSVAGEAARRAAHEAAWRAFWNRSHIAVTPASGSSPRVRFAFPYNAKLPVSHGCDSKGGTKFMGSLKVDPASRIDKDGLALVATFNAKDVRRNQRIIDNITPGGTDGSLVDILGGRLRLLVAQKAVYHPSTVPAGRDVSVAVRVSPDGKVKMYLDGKFHTADLADASIAAPATCAAVTRAWAAQRYTTACAGTGALPIRFNGSIFTTSENGDPDYRRWGHGYWWQNTRLPYYPVFAAGDFEVMQPLFRMYGDLAGFNVRRVRKYLGHGGAFFPECMMPWGDHFPYVYGVEHDWKDRPDKLQDGGWHKYEWVGQLEFSLMMLDYHAYTQDDAWFVAKALPVIREYVRFFDEHYRLDARGRYLMNPAQALETWWDCTNPMPEVAGLMCVTERLLALPKGLLPEADRALFARIRSRVPDLPVRKLGDGRTAYAPAERFDKKRNEEHPELYCVFPFRLCSFEKPNAALGRAACDARVDRKYNGWKQEELFAAYLGMADEAAAHLVNRVLHNSAAGFRWPAYWGPNFDWRPDQCAGGNIQNIIQSMLLQYEGDKIFLLPAWPKEWDCAFRLHAPRNTIVEGRVENGVLKGLVVTPASRRADVVVCR
ncbi:MAG: hypothetical protein IKL96_03480 [Kiritimatiellae bacterium]|nr:hypothetical protein [Kiritimatiellia bacterium]